MVSSATGKSTCVDEAAVGADGEVEVDARVAENAELDAVSPELKVAVDALAVGRFQVVSAGLQQGPA